jgi:Flp pilus assembly protein TadD
MNLGFHDMTVPKLFIQSHCPKRKRTLTIVALSLAVLTLVVYWQVQYYEFLVWDDYGYIVENPHVRAGLSLENLRWALSGTDVSYRHPLTWLSHMVDCEIYGLHPRGHHFNGLLFHLFSTVLLFLTLHRLTGKCWRSAFVAVLFSIHPLRIESVAWVSERKDVLGAFFWILTMLMYDWYTRQERMGRYLLVLLSFALGLMAKPMLVTLPFVLLLLDYWPLGRFRFGHSLDAHFSPLTRKHPLGFLIIEKIPLFFLVAASSLLTLRDAAKVGAVASTEALSLGFRLGHALVSYVKYIIKMVWPSDLSFFYPFPEIPWPFWQVAGCALLLGCFSLLAVFHSKQRPYLIVGWLWFLGTLLPVIGIVQVGAQAMADRFTYLPHLGLSIALIWGVADWASRWHLHRALLPGISCFIIALYAISTHQQLRYWRDGITLFSRALDVTSRNYTAHYQLGNELMRQGRRESAIQHYSEAVKLRPDHFPSHRNLGIALAAQGRFDEAINHYMTALKVQPRHAGILSNTGDAYLRQANFTGAIAFYSQALEVNPSLWAVHTNTGFAFLNKGMAREAVVHLEEALRLNPGDRKARHYLSIARENMEERINESDLLSSSRERESYLNK